MDMRLEVVVRPVSDVDRAKELYVRLGWRLDADFVAGDDFRVAESWATMAAVCASTAPASRKCTSPPSGNSTSPMKEWNCPPTPGTHALRPDRRTLFRDRGPAQTLCQLGRNRGSRRDRGGARVGWRK